MEDRKLLSAVTLTPLDQDVDLDVSRIIVSDGAFIVMWSQYPDIILRTGSLHNGDLTISPANPEPRYGRDFLAAGLYSPLRERLDLVRPALRDQVAWITEYGSLDSDAQKEDSADDSSWTVLSVSDSVVEASAQPPPSWFEQGAGSFWKTAADDDGDDGWRAPALATNNGYPTESRYDEWGQGESGSARLSFDPPCPGPAGGFMNLTRVPHTHVLAQWTWADELAGNVKDATPWSAATTDAFGRGGCFVFEWCDSLGGTSSLGLSHGTATAGDEGYVGGDLYHGDDLRVPCASGPSVVLSGTFEGVDDGLDGSTIQNSLQRQNAGYGRRTVICGEGDRQMGRPLGGTGNRNATFDEMWNSGGIELVRIPPDASLPSGRPDGFIELTHVLNEQVPDQEAWVENLADGAEPGTPRPERATEDGPGGGSERLGWSRPSGQDEATEAGHDSGEPGSTSGSPFDRIDGAQGVSQAFELAMTPERRAETAQMRDDTGPGSARASGLTESTRPTAPLQPGERAAGLHIGLFAPAPVDPQAGMDPASHEAVFAEMDGHVARLFDDGIFDDGLSGGVSVGKGRVADVIPVVVVATIGPYLARREWLGHNDKGTRRIRRSREPGGE